MTRHLLIADDEPSVLALLQVLFERQGYRVSTASDGRDALDQARQSMPDAIILDIQMPHMTGIDTVIALRADERYRDIPVIALTAHIRDYLPSTVSQAGFTHVLTKPFEIAELMAVVAQSLAPSTAR